MREIEDFHAATTHKVKLWALSSVLVGLASQDGFRPAKLAVASG